MPIPIERDSLTLGLEERYAKQPAGGAFNAKLAGDVLSDGFSNEFADGLTKGGQNTGMPKKDSAYVKGLDTRKYKP